MKENRLEKNKTFLGLNSRWPIWIAVAALVGAALRLSYPEDMEYKEDEEINFLASQLKSLPWLGMNSGVFIPNPGMSVWVFRILAQLTGAQDPLALTLAVRCLAWLGIALILPFVFKFFRQDSTQRQAWLWAFALAMVNPFFILYQKKLWPQPFLPAFVMITLAGWWMRDRFWGAWTWGFFGILLGQIHMSGFFYAAALAAVTWIGECDELPRTRVKWKGAALGTLVGALPLIPWAWAIYQSPPAQKAAFQWQEVVQLKFWVFLFSNPIGLHLGNPLGLLRGESTWAQLSDFVRYPLWQSQPTYLCGVFHITAALSAGAILVSALWRWIRSVHGARSGRPFFRIRWRTQTSTGLALIALVGVMGFALTFTGINIRRFYLMIAFPLDLVLFSLLALWGAPQWGRRALALLWISQLGMSSLFVHYIHVRQGSPDGDYGNAYHLQIQKPRAPILHFSHPELPPHESGR